jgi:hypothetical protein
MNLVIVFDTSVREEEVKKEMIAIGYLNYWYTSNTNLKYELPHNTLWKSNIEMRDALNDIRNVINNINLRQNNSIILQRCIVLSVTPWDGIPGVPLQTT